MLEVRTTRVSWPYFDDNGTPQTDKVELLERLLKEYVRCLRKDERQAVLKEIGELRH